MVYCEGKYCSRRDQCAYHETFEWKYPRQYLDSSTTGTAWGGIDENGNWFHHSRRDCGDNADNYVRYKALGYREGEEYTNSLGYQYDEVCVYCEHRHLCFTILELAGMVTRPGERVRFDCEKIKNNPEDAKKWVDTKIAIWELQKSLHKEEEK